MIQVYCIENREHQEKHVLLEISFTLMHLMAVVAEALTHLPSTENAQDCFAGMSFAMERALTPLSKNTELLIMLERFDVYEQKIRELQNDAKTYELEKPIVEICTRSLEQALAGIRSLKIKTAKLAQARKSLEPDAPSLPKAKVQVSPTVSNAPESSKEVEIAEGKELRVQFRSKRCIHFRHCVTESSKVFIANKPGEWIYPDQQPADILAGVIRECPSGALSYQSKGSVPDEPVPDVNVMRVSENGPYRFLADLEIDDKSDGFRATLCRCGLSKNKPYCDHTHLAAGFTATGEPDLISDQALKVRFGKLRVNRTQDGPLSVEGNVEICASTGYIVLRTSQVNLCRCGHSKRKPICDGTHAVIGFRDSVQS